LNLRVITTYLNIEVITLNLNAFKKTKHNMLTVCIAGKNNIAINGLNYLFEKYSHQLDICFLPNQDDNCIDGWQYSFRKFAEKLNIRHASLEELYKTKELIFISLEFSEIINTKKFITNRLFNIHFSLLPKYRGVYTSALPIMFGDKITGVTLHKIDDGIDTGDIIDQKSFKINDNDTSRDLYEKYLENGYLIFKKNIDKLIKQKFTAFPQSARDATYFSKKAIDFNVSEINFHKKALEVNNHIRAFTFREYQLPKFKNHEIYKSQVINEISSIPPGLIVKEDSGSFIISTLDFNIKLYKDYYELLWSLCKEGNLEAIKKILTHIPDINLKNKFGWNAIIIAKFNGHLNLVRYLVEMGADLDLTSNN